MSALEQSLDAIIARDRAAAKKTRVQKRQAAKPAAKQVAKGPKAVKGAKPVKTVPRAAIKPALKARALAALAAEMPTTTKVMVGGLPRDINGASIKEFFNAQVGGCQSVHVAYNAQGKSTGNATVIFKTAKAAKAAVAKYQNAPIDGGKSRLTLELVIDPTKRPLAARIMANKPVARAAVKKIAAKKAPAKTTKAAKTPSKAIRAKRPAKKTLEQLDAEMADYFATNEA